MTETINAAQNPDLANKAAEEVNKSAPKPKATIVPPPETVVTLPGGYVTSTGEVVTEAEVRELNGRDEEVIARSNNAGKVLTTILERGTVKIGGEDASESLLDQLFSGDRDYLLLSIYKATFGSTATTNGFCRGCDEYKEIEVDIDDDIKVEKLNDPIADRKFEVQGRSTTYTCVLPSGKTQKELMLNGDKSLAELTTILLAGCIREINGKSVISRKQIQDIGVADRRILAESINDKVFGPVFDDVVVDCHDCGGKVVSPISIGNLFRF